MQKEVALKKQLQIFRHKVDYKGDTNERTYGSDDSPSETNDCARDLAKEHEN